MKPLASKIQIAERLEPAATNQMEAACTFSGTELEFLHDTGHDADGKVDQI